MDFRNGSPGKNVDMNKKTIYQNIAELGNKEIVYLVTRSLFPIEEDLEVKVDILRLSDELELYKYFLHKGKGSIISALMPLILSNSAYEKAVNNTYDLYKLVRKKLTLRNKIGVNLLVYYIFSIEDDTIEFSKISMIESTKKEEVEFQKAKIDIILNKISIEEAIVDFLDEKQIEMNLELLQRSNEDIIHEDDYLYKMSLYFQKVCLFQIKKKPYIEKINMSKLFSSEVNQVYYSPLIGEYCIKSKKNIDEITIIMLDAKMGELELCYKKDKREVS